MNTNETKQSIADLSLKLIDAMAYPGSKETVIALYKSSEFLYTININYNEEKYHNFKLLAQSRSNNNDYLFQDKNDSDTIYTLKYLDNQNDIHAFLINPTYEKINSAELLKTDAIPECN